MTRSLTLRRESLVELTTAELSFRGAGEGDPQPTPPVWAPRTLVVRECLATAFC